MGQGASPEIKEDVYARNRRMAHWIARSTHGRGRPKSGKDDLGSPVRFYRVRVLGKLHGSLAKRNLDVTGAGWPWWPRLGQWWRGVLEAKSGELRLRQGLRASGEVWPRPWVAL
jgi:hypothetical protein